MNKIDLIDRNSGLEYNTELIENFCYEVLSILNVDNWEFTLLFGTDEYIAELNNYYRGKDGPTDVLTFCERDSPGDWKQITDDDSLYYSGDIIISIETMKKNSKYFKVDEKTELKRLIIHGILHLQGHDHKTNNEDEEMLIRQESILEKLGEYTF